MKKFSVGHEYLLCVFVGFIRLISIHRNKREGHTTFRWDPTLRNARYGRFFRIFYRSEWFKHRFLQLNYLGYSKIGLNEEAVEV